MTISELIQRLDRYSGDMKVFLNRDGMLETPLVRLVDAIPSENGFDYEELILDDPNKEKVVSIGVAF